MGARGQLRPRVLTSPLHDLSVGGVLARGAPGEGLRNADEGMQKDKDRFEEPAIGLDQRDAVGRISKLFRLHKRDDSKDDGALGDAGEAMQQTETTRNLARRLLVIGLE